MHDACFSPSNIFVSSQIYLVKFDKICIPGKYVITSQMYYQIYATDELILVVSLKEQLTNI